MGNIENASITIFTIPKSFRESHTDIIQTNAIKSWKCLGCDVVLIGDDFGVAEKAQELNVAHIFGVACNEFNTPLLSSAFLLVRNVFDNKYIMYINADIILFKDFINIYKHLSELKDFLIVGQRHMLEVYKKINFQNDWEVEFRKKISSVSYLDAINAIDYFLFKRSSFQNIPDFAVGRIGWDNWMIYEARRKKMAVIDATKMITAVHQKHDCIQHVNSDDNRHSNPEAKNNLKHIGGSKYIFDISDTNYEIRKEKIKKKFFSWYQKERYLRDTPEVLDYAGFWIVVNYVYLGLRTLLKIILPKIIVNYVRDLRSNKK